MSGNAYLIVLSITSIVAIILMVAIKRPARTSTNGSSNTLGLAKLSLFFIFVVVILDTMNDVVPQRQLAARSNTKASAQLASKSKRTRRHALIRRRRTTDKKREVNKDKYWLLGFVFLVCMGSYIARHPRIAEFWERLAAAWKGNPIPNQSDTMEDFMITYLLQNPDSEHERWFLRALVAKAGGNPLEGLEPAQYTNDEPIIVDPGESLEGYDGESN